MSENLAKSGKRYICFTPEMQEDFDRLPEKHQRFVKFYANGGFSKKAAYVAAGYTDSKNAKNSAYDLAKNIARFDEFVAALQGQKNVTDAYDPESEVSKKIDEIAEGDLLPTPIVPAEIEGTGAKLDLAEMSAEQAKRIQFFRDIASGKTKTVKKTKTFDREGKCTGSKVEEITDVAMQMRARFELDKALGMNEMMKVGQITAGKVTINIVDCSNHAELDDKRNDIFDGELSEETSAGGENE